MPQIKCILLTASSVAFLTVLASSSQNASVIFDHRQVTPNTSRIIQATPSKIQPSPTVHTKEALGKCVIP